MKWKCQACSEAATHHVTDIVAGQPVEYHVCDAHFQNLDDLQPAAVPDRPAQGFPGLLSDPKLNEALRDPVVRQQVTAHLLRWGETGAQATRRALRDALRNPDERERKAAEITLELMERGEQAARSWFL